MLLTTATDDDDDVDDDDDEGWMEVPSNCSKSRGS